MNKLVSIRAPIKLLNAINQINPKSEDSQSKVLIGMLKCGYYYKKYDCKEILMNMREHGSISQQRRSSLRNGIWIGIAIGILFSISIAIIIALTLK